MGKSKTMGRIRMLWDTNKGIHYDNIKQIKPGDMCYKNNNCVHMAICNTRTINRKEETIL